MITNYVQICRIQKKYLQLLVTTIVTIITFQNFCACIFAVFITFVIFRLFNVIICTIFTSVSTFIASFRCNLLEKLSMKFNKEVDMDLMLSENFM